jgi:hypothetical protein
VKGVAILGNGPSMITLDTNAGPEQFTAEAFDVDKCPECACGHPAIQHRVHWVKSSKEYTPGQPRMANLGYCVCRYDYNCTCRLFNPKAE